MIFVYVGVLTLLLLPLLRLLANSSDLFVAAGIASVWIADGAGRQASGLLESAYSTGAPCFSDSHAFITSS